MEYYEVEEINVMLRSTSGKLINVYAVFNGP